ncbi:HAMP domain-containing sensor histidine kinase [Agromyces aureus]|uniref:HAMP domain-containing sensor histidine kinase n=1 Tax=Agromyces aureus TaxID=453304 RepID=UPI000A9E3BBF|nr:HAMP domain-containing sensor histidine kinase [Agromyces aureus]
MVIAVVMLIGAVAFSVVLRGTVLDTAARAGETRLELLAGEIRTQGSSAVEAADDEIVQLLSASGEVVAASEDAPDDPLPFGDESQVSTVDGDPVLVLAEGVDDDGTLVLAVPVEDDLETLGTVSMLLAVSVPLVVLLVAALTWVVMGRALRPVARITAEVDDITADRLDRRVPVPASGDEIAALAETMNAMLGRLDASASAQRRFVSDASHELRSPLATIRQHAELAQAHPEVTSLHELSDVALDEGRRLQALVDSLLLLARLDEGAPTGDEPVDLDDLALAEGSRLRAAGIAVDVSGVGPARVHGDPQLLGRLVRNLADNAARHARGRVAIGLSERDGSAVLVVDDDGAGIPESQRERVFDRFVRLDDARDRDAGGSGLGLAIVLGVARATGGDVLIEDAPLGGARFIVRLPAAL